MKEKYLGIQTIRKGKIEEHTTAVHQVSKKLKRRKKMRLSVAEFQPLVPAEIEKKAGWKCSSA
jgi:hypothetical protein